jgi:radical SAM protein with 4Fe4S-binding SPASM domain
LFDRAVLDNFRDLQEKFTINLDRKNEFFEFNLSRHIYKSYFGLCDAMKNHIVILANGDVTTCCYDYEGRNVFGNAKTNDMMEIITSRPATILGNKLKRGVLPTETCRMCFGSNSFGKYWLKQLYVLGQFLKVKPEKSFM